MIEISVQQQTSCVDIWAKGLAAGEAGQGDGVVRGGHGEGDDELEDLSREGWHCCLRSCGANRYEEEREAIAKVSL